MNWSDLSLFEKCPHAAETRSCWFQRQLAGTGSSLSLELCWALGAHFFTSSLSLPVDVGKCRKTLSSGTAGPGKCEIPPKEQSVARQIQDPGALVVPGEVAFPL